MKRYNLIIFLIIFYHSQAQETPARYTPVNNYFFSDLLEEVSVQPANYLYMSVKDYTASSLFFNSESGQLKQAAAPGYLHEIGLGTQGLYRSDSKMLFFGKLAIQKSYYSNLKWNLSYAMPEKGRMPDPHYFGVSRAGKWSNQAYELSGGFLLPVAPRVHLFIKADYELFSKYRTDLDPRAEITYNELDFEAGINYDLSEQHHIKLSGSYAYADVANEIVFSNRNVNYPANHELYVKWIAGYGTHTNPARNVLSRDFNKVAINAGHTYSSETFLLFSDVSYVKKDQRTYEDDEIFKEDNANAVFSDYQPQIFSLTSTAVKTLNNNNFFKIHLSLENYSANNFWHSKGGKTYSATENSLDLKLSYLQMQARETNFDTGLELSVWKVYQEDGLSQTLSEYSNFEPAIYALKQFDLKGNLSISPFTRLHLRYNMNHRFYNGNEDYLANIAEDDFAGIHLKNYYEQVIYRDHQLFSTPVMGINIGARLKFPIFSEMQAVLHLEAGNKTAFRDLTAFEDPNANRFNTSFSFNIYY